MNNSILMLLHESIESCIPFMFYMCLSFLEPTSIIPAIFGSTAGLSFSKEEHPTNMRWQCRDKNVKPSLDA